MPGSTPATSQLDWLISTTAMIVLSWSNATRDLIKACPGAGRGRSAGASGHSVSYLPATMVPSPSPPAPYHLSAGGRWIRTVGTADDARLLADLYAHNASRQMPQKGSSDQTVACFRRLGAGVVGSAAVCAFRFRPPGTGSKRAGLAPIGRHLRLLRRGVLRTGCFPRQGCVSRRS